jgi:hypothetical protein
VRRDQWPRHGVCSFAAYDGYRVIGINATKWPTNENQNTNGPAERRASVIYPLSHPRGHATSLKSLLPSEN